jgi:hypothetical protein
MKKKPRYTFKKVDSAITEVYMRGVHIGNIYLLPFVYSKDFGNYDPYYYYFIEFTVTSEYDFTNDYRFAKTVIKEAWKAYKDLAINKLETNTL